LYNKKSENKQKVVVLSSDFVVVSSDFVVVSSDFAYFLQKKSKSRFFLQIIERDFVKSVICLFVRYLPFVICLFVIFIIVLKQKTAPVFSRSCLFAL